MAEWTDGVEYAPADRPWGFAAPRTEGLPAGPPEVSPARGLPTQQPDLFQPPPAGPPLQDLVPKTGPTRDPHLAFGTQTTAMTTGAWGSAHTSTSTLTGTRDPSAPIITSGQLSDGATAVLTDPAAPLGVPGGLPWPGDPSQYQPTDGPSGQQPPISARLIDVLGTLGWPILIILVVGSLVQPLSWPMLVCATVLAGFHKNATLGRRIRLVTAIAAIASVLLGFLLMLRQDVLWQMATYAQIGCVISLASAAIMAAALATDTDPSAGPPTPPPPASWLPH